METAATGTTTGAVTEATDTAVGVGVVMTAEDHLGETTMTDRRAGTTMMMIDAGTVIVKMMVDGEGGTVGMTGETVGVAEEARKAMGSGRRRGARLRLRVLFRFRKGRGRPLGGMSMRLGMSSTLPCRLSRLASFSQVCAILDPMLILAVPLGLFNLPGANRTQVPPILGIPGLPAPMPVQSFGMGIGGNPNLSRQSRRLYIGSITTEVNEQNLSDFFNQKMNEMNIGTGGPGDPVLAVQCNYEKNYAFVEVNYFSVCTLLSVINLAVVPQL